MQSNVRYLGFVNKEADEASKKASRYKLKDGKVDVNYAAFFKALVRLIAFLGFDVQSILVFLVFLLDMYSYDMHS